MRILVQRSLNSNVSVSGKVTGKIDKGLVLFIGFTLNDSEKEIDYLIKKVLNLRIFDDENGVMNKSLLDINGKVLSIFSLLYMLIIKKVIDQVMRKL